MVPKTVNLQEIPFVWHNMTSKEYEKQVKEKGNMKKFDFIHMIQMLYYIDDLAETIKFFHSLLKKNGMLMIMHNAPGGGWGILWKKYKNVLTNKSNMDLMVEEIIFHLNSLGLNYKEHIIPIYVDITDCFTEGNEMGELLLHFLTDQVNFYQSLNPELRAGILDLLRNTCSTEKNGRVTYRNYISCIIVHA
ncbi:hypothetical protein LDENG_00265810 [Lucifuga dentata]|nr:hypothetical protein LDENG_00265810 [Lucifuga dentata]